MPSIHDLDIKENSAFLKLKEGNTVVRIVSNFVVRTVTYKSGDQGVKYTCRVIDRTDGELRIADFGTKIMKQLKKLAESKDYGFTDLPGYDITINREGSGQFDTIYTVTPARADSLLTEDEKHRIEEAGSLETFLNKGVPKVTEPGEPGYINVEDLPF